MNPAPSLPGEIDPGPLHPADEALRLAIMAGMDTSIDLGPQVEFPWDWRRVPAHPAPYRLGRPRTVSDPWRVVGRLYAYMPRRPLAPEACWPWYGMARTNAGLGRLSYNGLTVPIPRLSWQFHFGPLPHGARLRKAPYCDGCGRPDHWRLT